MGLQPMVEFGLIGWVIMFLQFHDMLEGLRMFIGGWCDELTCCGCWYCAMLHVYRMIDGMKLEES